MYLIALSVGFMHAFEADHLLAVSSLTTQRKHKLLAIKDGAYWGFGHTVILLAVGLVFMLGKWAIDINQFKYLEASVGFMLFFLGLYRFYRLIINAASDHVHQADGSHKLAFGVGIIHGLAGSGAVLISLLAQSKNNFSSFVYLLIFGFGSMAGMMLAAGLISLPFSSKFFGNKYIFKILSFTSSILCIVFGLLIIYRNLNL